MLPIQSISLSSPYPVGPVNVYAIPEPPFTLIDCGPDTEEAYQRLNSILPETAGFKLSEVRRILVTHAHSDHFGLAGRIQKETGAEVWIGPKEYNKIFLYESTKKAELEALAVHGVPEPVLNSFDRMVEWEKKWVAPLDDVRWLSEGQETVFDNGKSLRAIFAPGHTQGHVCFYDSEGRLFSGDTVLKGIIPNPLIDISDPEMRVRPPSLLAYLDTLGKISEMDIDLVLPGHGSSFGQARQVITDLLGYLDARTETICGLIEPAGNTIFELASKLYGHRDLNTGDTFLSVCGVLGHLDRLELQGRAAAVNQEGNVRYFRSDPG